MKRKKDYINPLNENSIICQNCRNWQAVTKPQLTKKHPSLFNRHTGNCAHTGDVLWVNSYNCQKFEKLETVSL